MHDLNLPRAYQTVYVCGAFGIGGDRDHDQEALHHFRDHLRPGGALVMDTRLPYRDAGNWQDWLKGNRRALPEASTPHRVPADGSELDLAARVVDLDPPAQVITYEMRGRRWRHGHLKPTSATSSRKPSTSATICS